MDAVLGRVRETIDALGETHRELASAIGLEPTKLSKSLHGSRRFRPDELAAIASRAGVTVDWLVHGDDGSGQSQGRGYFDLAGPRRAAPSARQGGSGPALDGSLVRPEDDADPRTRILEAAWRLIAVRGFHSVRVADIAWSCSTSPAAVHYYFPTKADVLEAALSHCVESAFARQTAELRAIDDARDRMLRLIEAQLPTDGRIRDEWSVWLQFWAEAALRPHLRPAHNEFYARWAEAVTRIIQRGQRQGVMRDVDPQAMAQQFTALTDGFGIKVLTEAPGVTVATMREALLDFVRSEIFLTGEGG